MDMQFGLGLKLALGGFDKHKKPLFLSKETLITHIKEHPEIKSYDYALISEIIKRGKKARIGTKEIRFILTIGKKYYFLAIKDVDNKDEIFITTLFCKKNNKWHQLGKLIDVISDCHSFNSHCTHLVISALTHLSHISDFNSYASAKGIINKHY